MAKANEIKCDACGKVLDLWDSVEGLCEDCYGSICGCGRINCDGSHGL